MLLMSGQVTAGGTRSRDENELIDYGRQHKSVARGTGGTQHCNDESRNIWFLGSFDEWMKKAGEEDAASGGAQIYKIKG